MDFVNANLGSALQPAILLDSTPNTEDVPSSDLRPARSAPRPPKGRGQGGAKARTRAQSGRAQARSPGDVGARVLARSRLAGAPRVSVPRVDCAGASLQDGGGGSWPSEAGGFGSVAPEPAPAGPGAVSSGPALSQESKVGRGGGRGPH